MIKAVLFDVGNVIINWSRENLYDKLITDPARRAYFLDTVAPMEWHMKHDAGVTFADNRQDRLIAHPDFHDEIMAFDERFEEMLGELIPETIAVIEELHDKGVNMYGLTNMPQEKAAMVFSKSPVFGWFKDIIISGDEKISKPEPAIFDLTVRRLGVAPGEIFFTDDSAANIAGAKAAGFVTHLFDTPETLRPALVAAGVL